MARTVEEIKSQITSFFIAQPAIKEAYQLVDGQDFDSQFSKVSLESILFHDIAFTSQQLENLFDAHKAEVLDYIAKMKPHSAQWYAERARAFQDGFDLLPDGLDFDNAGRTDDEIEASKIVKYSAAIEQRDGLKIKAAKVESNDLAPLSDEEMSRFTYYMSKIKDAGVHLDILTADAQYLKIDLTIYYNPLILTSAGNRVDGSADNVVKEAIKSYLNSIEFDGMLVVAHLIDALQRVEGIEIPHINNNPAPNWGIAYRYGDLAWMPIEVTHRPDSGYIRLDDNALTINYMPR